MATHLRNAVELAICIHNADHSVSLEVRKLYVVIRDPEAAGLGQLRVIDESGEDYLYPAEYFARVQLPKQIEQAIIEAA
jgi:hypothetical protein